MTGLIMIKTWKRLPIVVVLLGLLLLVTGMQGRAFAGSFEAGGLLFSDELGGFRLLAASGSGTPSDPIVLIEELTSVQPAILTIRPAGALPAFSSAQGIVKRSLIKIVTNLSARRWAGFDLELRDGGGQASVYSDGLSFDQPKSVKQPLSSDRFATSHVQDEPFDRLRFDNGHVLAEDQVRLSFNVVDLNPRPIFYLVQEPIILLTERRVPPIHPRFADAGPSANVD